MSEALNKALPDLGRRVERLLYFGSILLLLCFVELYFVSAARFVGEESPGRIAELAAKIKSEKDQLQKLFEAKPKSVLTPADTREKLAVANMRKRLGLPPQTEEVKPTGETYEDALTRLLHQLPYWYTLADTTRQLARDISTSPDQKLLKLGQLQEELLSRPATIWGIKTPLVLPMKYAGIEYQIPAEFIARAAFFALAPLALGWLLSLVITRERELMIMRGISDYRLTFPHVLNMLAVSLDWGSLATDEKKLSRKQITRTYVGGKIFFALFRSIILLIFCLPMVVILSYCGWVLFVDLQDFPWAFFVASPIVVVAILYLVIQEWTVLWRKNYSVRM